MTVHLINPLWDDSGGSEWRTIGLYDLLIGRGSVRLWSEFDPHPTFMAKYPIERIVPEQGRFPLKGTLVVVGTYYPLGSWLEASMPDRVILIHNTLQPRNLDQRIRRLRTLFGNQLEIVHASELLRDQSGVPGRVEASPLNLETFRPARLAKTGALTLGRLSRNSSLKHHPGDPALYQKLVQKGCRIRIMGASEAISADLSGRENVELLTPGALPAEQFLQGLDLFFFRTDPAWVEPWGRVVAEAMACGLPVVCHAEGGYREIIEHGRNGFLISSEEEALETIMKLRDDPDLRQLVGQAARARVERTFGQEYREKIARFYLG